MAKSMRFGIHEVFYDETYFVAYAGGKRELSAKDQKEYNGIIQLPFEAQQHELRRQGYAKNPNVVPIKGIDLITLIKDRKLFPAFDAFFTKSHLLQVNDLVVFESMRQKSYDIARG